MPGGRRNKYIELDGQIITRRTRPWQVTDQMFREMADASTKANAKYIQNVCNDIADVVTFNGRRYRLRGARGNRVPLEGKADVKAFWAQGDRSFKLVGAVRGIPEGFWHIVEYGSGRHVIYSRRSKSGMMRTSKSGKVRQEFLTPTQAKRRFNKQQSMGDLRPLAPATRAWAAQYVVHPGHGSIGRPWAQSMDAAKVLVADELTAEQSVAMFKAWRG